jgi:hypothetical protein
MSDQLKRKMCGLTRMERAIVQAIYANTGEIPNGMIRLFRSQRAFNTRVKKPA